VKEYIKEAQKTYRYLRELEISAYDSRRLVKCSYTCLDRVFGTPAIVDELVEIMSKAEMKGDEALSMIEKKLFGVFC
jgi:hypothetical protein